MLIFAPKVSAESSINFRLYLFAIFLIDGQFGMLPMRLGTNIAEVFLFIFSVINFSSICKVYLSTSTNIGFRPLMTSEDIAVPKFKQGIITSLPFLRFKILSAKRIADDPEFTIIPYFLLKIFATFFSKSKTFFDICVVLFKQFITALTSSFPYTFFP